ncbi:flagellar filament capping protein FliD [Oceanisphaera sp. W20_SRM_FM3]|uniref:flagellar filament capping protein FliD n=1 Tax=Oceanisphaera sp. W20_SRM_FM3 TaxID=3240267 RepID=UPI003F96A738
MDPSSMAQMLTSADRAPLDRLLKNQQSQLSGQKAAYGKIKDKLQGLQDSLKALTTGKGLQSQSATFSADGFMSATVKTGAANANYQLFVKQLAQADQQALTLAEDWKAPTQGKLEIGLDGTNLSVDLATLNGGGLTELRDAINKSPDNKGVTASLIRSGGETQLLLTSAKTGESQSMNVSVTGGNGEASFTALETAMSTRTQLSQAQDAVVKLGSAAGGVGGLELKSSTNTFDGQIDGLNLTVTKAHGDTDAPLSLTVATDQSAIESSLEGIVSAYNALVTEVEQQTRSKEGKTAALSGDSMSRGLLDRLRSTLSSPGTGTSLAELGIKTDKNGKLSLDTAAMAKLQQDKPGALETALTGADGLFTRLEADTKPYLDRNGVFVQREQSLKTGLDRITDRQEALDLRMDKTYQRYLSQFTRMNTLAQQMQQTMGMF